jgi:hypothetical protein
MSEARGRVARGGWVIALVLAVLAAASCSAPAQRTASPSPPSQGPSEMASPPPASPLPEVPRELEFTAPQLGGGTIRGASFAGRDLVMWFWAPW